jgi:hypothetical protein
VIYGSEYWKKVFNLEALVDTGTISPKDIELFQFADTPEEAFEMLKTGLTANYLEPEAARVAAVPAVATDPEALSHLNIEEFLGPEMAKTSK